MAWELAWRLGLFPHSAFPSPLEVVNGFGEELRTGRLFDEVISSLYRVTLGFTLAVVLGVPIGLWLGHRRWARAALLPWINFFRVLSPIAWIPFAILWFGINDPPAIFLVFMACFFPLTLATISAVAAIPIVFFRVGEDYGMRGSELLRRITLPAILPELIRVLRVTAGVAWLVVVAAEMVGTQSGLGFLINDARNGLRMDLVVCGMIAIGVIGMLLDRVIVQLTRLPSVRWGYES
jgi:NitT/TauT family transport system permease protein